MTGTVSATTLAEIGDLVGDPARANILLALVGGLALPAGELAWHAHVTAQTASGHLARLTQAGLLAAERSGRHRYYRLASPLVGQMLEGMSLVASTDGARRRRSFSRIDEALRQARTCYDHLAGRLGVALADALQERGHVVLSEDGGTVTEKGQRFLAGLGIDLAAPARRMRPFCRPCLDWSERRHHLAGTLGTRLRDHCFEAGWVERLPDTRAVALTPLGEERLATLLGISLEAAAEAA